MYLAAPSKLTEQPTIDPWHATLANGHRALPTKPTIVATASFELNEMFGYMPLITSVHSDALTP